MRSHVTSKLAQNAAAPPPCHLTGVVITPRQQGPVSFQQMAGRTGAKQGGRSLRTCSQHDTLEAVTTTHEGITREPLRPAFPCLLILYSNLCPHAYLAPVISPILPRGTRSKGPRSALAEVHRQRRDLLRRACSLHTRRQRLLQPRDLRHVLVDDAHGLLYCYVPKVASTNWKRVLLALSGRAPGDPRAIPAHEAHAPGRLPSLADFGPADVNRRLRSYLAFLFVREPFERLASAYRNKLARPWGAAFQLRYGTRIVRRLRPGARPDAVARGHDVRFAEFLAYLLDPRTRREEPFNEHWERVHALCHPCLLRYDVVGKFETLAEDAAFVLGLAGASGLSFPGPPPRPKAAATAPRELAARLFQDISPFYQRRLYDLYKMDFLLFNYSVPSYLRLR
ncbi:PREDICTED: carbohydrate sulfotransferase 13 [Propithecus coquereli]|uniref:carbohydrate sulfotransferase 13 n=1 Tax=Propithecus coquereli TaxID=379532 RepID=UPI00063F8D9B|nr:PREDICTED: carbohydrate sulfotransferase 13 [Propithecus coquereli]